MPKRLIKGLLIVIALVAAGVAFVRFNQPTGVYTAERVAPDEQQ